ncbi:DUF2255 family protein [Actinoplanes sp. NPDC049265]|uniref:DUF2255 family protein n=1 Tax=Actinoplanes sp. NPDC049265 TaxID=3363902 RepID=UPI00371431AD
MDAWSPAQLADIGSAYELEILGRRWTTIWAVVAGTQVYVRTWHRRDTGWYGHVLRTGHARVRVPGLEAGVRVEDIGLAERDAVDAAYRAKYAGGAASMVTDTAATSTLRLSPLASPPAR